MVGLKGATVVPANSSSDNSLRVKDRTLLEGSWIWLPVQDRINWRLPLPVTVSINHTRIVPRSFSGILPLRVRRAVTAKPLRREKQLFGFDEVSRLTIWRGQVVDQRWFRLKIQPSHTVLTQTHCLMQVLLNLSSNLKPSRFQSKSSLSSSCFFHEQIFYPEQRADCYAPQLL